MRIGILKNQNPDSVEKWVLACKNLDLDHRVVDLTSNHWLEEIQSGAFDFFIHRPPGDLERFKGLFDDRLYILSEELNYMVFPSYRETLIYENKKMLSYFLKAHAIPHPETKVFYHYQESMDYLLQALYPIVAKSNIGAAGSGVQVLKERKAAEKYLHKAFKQKGIPRRFGPNRKMGTPQSWLLKAIREPGLLKSKMLSYKQIYKDRQFGYVLLQNYIPHEFEWRVAKIGESYFAYKKHRVGEKASGAKDLSYDNPPTSLLDFIRTTASTHQITSAAFDIFCSKESYLINEIQTIFGHINDHILEVNGIPGRYTYKNNQWEFEEGNFNSNESYDLRLEVAINLFNDSRKK